MPSPPDRPVHILEQFAPANPHPPLNLFCSSGFLPGVFDLRWSPAAELASNSRFSIVGANIYRSFNSEYGPFFRLNPVPIGASFYRDQIETVVALQEDVSQSFQARGPSSDGDGLYIFRTANKPIVLTQAIGAPDITNLNVFVTINGVQAFVEGIRPQTGEVELRRYPTFDVVSQTFTQPVLPTSSSDIVLATYKYKRNLVRTDLAQRIFYRVTTVAFDSATNTLVETSLERAARTNNFEIEKIDYMWTEAVRRQRWLLDHGGERVKLFIRRSAGTQCGCSSDTHKQPSATCLGCFGTGILGGYDGPYDITIAPDDAAKKSSQSARGRTLDHSYDTWTLPSPLVSQRDFIVKMNNDRYGIGPVRMPSNRGMQLQQMFTISHIDEQDIRYKLPIPDPTQLYAPSTNYVVPGEGGSTPMITERSAIPDEREIRGATVTFENTLRR